MSTSATTSPRQFRANFISMLSALARPEAFPFAVPGGEPLVVQTHASAVLLAGDRAYKLKKPVNLGFLDYSTPALRRRFCILEAQLNARLSPRVYLGVAPVLALPGKALRFGRHVAPEQVTAPGEFSGDGEVVDYAAVTFLECVCPRDVALYRLAARWTARTRQSRRGEAGVAGEASDEGDAGSEASAASDGRPALYDAQRAAWEPFSTADEPAVQHVRVDTGAPVAASVEAALGALGMHS